MYWRHVASPVPQRFGGQSGRTLPHDGLTEVLPGRAWVVPQLLSEAECAAVVEFGEAFGLEPAQGASGVQGLRTSKRTTNLCHPGLAALVGPRLPETLLQAVEAARPHTAVRGVHPNWRIARYDQGDAFPAHYDQADCLTVQGGHGKERFDSSHTLLISLSHRSAFDGGATRFWPTGKCDDTAVDVELPCGHALVFEQRGLLHAGLAVRSGVKHIAQVGILRGAPRGLASAPSVFRVGPGVAPR